MMSGNTEILYWREDKEWYSYDSANDLYSLTDKAPDMAIKSFELWKKANNLK